MAKNTQATQATPAQATQATPAQATPTAANLLATLQAGTQAKQQGVFITAANAAFNAQLPLCIAGVQAPQRAGACATVWLQVLQHLQTNNALPTCAQVVAALPACNVNNVKIEAYRAFKWLQGVPAHLAQAQAQQP